MLFFTKEFPLKYRIRRCCVLLCVCDCRCFEGIMKMEEFNGRMFASSTNTVRLRRKNLGVKQSHSEPLNKENDDTCGKVIHSSLTLIYE